jgi:hypothetical protein
LSSAQYIDREAGARLGHVGQYRADAARFVVRGNHHDQRSEGRLTVPGAEVVERLGIGLVRIALQRRPCLVLAKDRPQTDCSREREEHESWQLIAPGELKGC